MDPQQYREQAMAAIDDIAKYYETLPNLRCLSTVSPGYLRPLLPPTAPEHPEPFSAIQSDIQTKVLPGLTHWQSPSFMAFFPASVSHPAMVAEMYSNAFNGAHFNWICSPAATELETVVLDWMAKALKLPECYEATGGIGGGVIHGSASEAILTAMTAAREKYLVAHLKDLPCTTEAEQETYEDCKADLRGKLVALSSSMTHSATKKAALILGVRYRSVPVTHSTNYQLTGAPLKETIRALRAKGLHPFFLTTNYGTTDVCAVDDFSSIATALRETAALTPSETQKFTETQNNADARDIQDTLTGDVWVHVDAAYAGSALILPEHQNNPTSPTAPSAPAIFALFHSFNFNPHKWLLVNFDCSVFYVRKARYLVDALSVAPAYLRNAFSDTGLVTDYRDWQIPLGRRFRALKLWFVLRMFGLEGLRGHLRKGIAMGELLAEKLKTRPDLFEILYGPCYALVVFKMAKKAGAAYAEGSEEDKKDRDDRGKIAYETINSKGEIFLTSSIIGGDYAIRVSTAGYTVDAAHINKTFDILVQEAKATLRP